MLVKKYHDSHCDDFVVTFIPKLIIDLNYGENNDAKYIYDKQLKSVG